LMDFDLTDNEKIVGKVNYKRENGDRIDGVRFYDVTVTFLITDNDYSFEEFSVIHSLSEITGLTRESFSTFRKESNGGVFEFKNVAAGAYWLGLYANLSGKCP
jgi:hypothetical protein